MRNIIYCLFTLIFLNNLGATNIDESNFLDFLTDKEFLSAEFSQTTFKDGQKRQIKGEIKANRKGMFKVVYQEPLNEIISSDGIQLYRLDKEIEQLDVSQIDATLSESPIGIFSSKKEELEELFEVTECTISKQQVICTVEPKVEESFLKRVTLQLNDDELRTLSYVDSFEQKVILDFTYISWDEMPDSEFLLEIPEGIDVVKH